jgi:hypothetical protein
MRTCVQAEDRLAVKSDAHSLSHTLTTRYSMSIAEAECLTQELQRKQLAEDPGALLDGQSFYTAIDRDEPAGKPLAKCRTVRIRLSLHTPDDLAYRSEHGLAGLQRLLVSRVCHEAYVNIRPRAVHQFSAKAVHTFSAKVVQWFSPGQCHLSGQTVS